MRFSLKLVIAGLVCPLILQAGRASAQNQDGSPGSTSLQCDAYGTHDAGGGIAVEAGKKRPIVDGLGWVMGIPRKVLLWDSRADNHDVSEQTVSEVVQYLDYRGLEQTVVRVNQYAPGREWQRLTKNTDIAPGWRYTVGTLKWLKYTLIPGRIFGRDEYNPYTNSLYLYSDMPSMALAEAAYATDVSFRRMPGTYAAVQELPIAALWHETLATEEVMDYVELYGSSEAYQDVRRDLYARYGLEAAGAIGGVGVQGVDVLPVVGAVAGHTTATVKELSGQ